MKLESGRVVKKGDPVPEADKWTEEILRAHLRLGNIIEVKPGPLAINIEVPPKRGRGRPPTKGR